MESVVKEELVSAVATAASSVVATDPSTAVSAAALMDSKLQALKAASHSRSPKKQITRSDLNITEELSPEVQAWLQSRSFPNAAATHHTNTAVDHSVTELAAGPIAVIDAHCSLVCCGMRAVDSQLTARVPVCVV